MAPVDAGLDEPLRIADGYFRFSGYLPLQSFRLIPLIADQSAYALLDFAEDA
jgi:hypothetical protein